MSIQDLVKDKNSVIIDVRETFEFEMEHIEGALHIPLSQIPEKMGEIKSMEGNKVLYCRSGGRSGQAVAFLKQNGIDEVYNGGGLHEMKLYMI